MQFPNIPLNYIYEFICLADNLNYTETAKKYFLSQPTLSRHMSDLEKILQAELIIRTTHSVELTSAGEKAHLAFQKMADTYSALLQELDELSTGKSGKLTIASLTYDIEAFINQYIGPYMQQYPQVSLSLKSLQSHQIVEALKSGSCDLGYLMKTPELSEKEFDFFSTSHERLYLITRKELDVEQMELLREMENSTMIIIDKDWQYTNNINVLLKQANVAIQHTRHVEQVDLVPMALNARDSFFIGPDMFRKMSNDLLFYPLDDSLFALEMGLYHPKYSTNPCIQKFLEWISC